MDSTGTQALVSSCPLGESAAGCSEAQPHWQILKILAINLTEEPFYLSNSLGFSFSSLQVE